MPKSAADIITAKGGTRALHKLSRPSYPLLAPDTADLLSAALTAASAAGSIPGGAAQRRWLSELLGVVMRPEAAPGFNHWLATKTSGATSAWRGMPMFFVSVWAEATHGRRDGWNERLDWGKACLRADAWFDGQERQAVAVAKTAKTSEPDALPSVFPTDMGVGRFRIRQFTSLKDLREAGDTLQVCIGYVAEKFAALARRGETTYLGIYETRRPKDEKENSKGEVVVVGKLLSIAEIGLRDGRRRRVTEHRGPRNSEPTPAQRQAVAEYLEIHREGI